MGRVQEGEGTRAVSPRSKLGAKAPGAFLVFLILALASLASWWLLSRSQERSQQADFQREAERITRLIEDSVDDIGHVQGGYRALFKGSEEVTHAEFEQASRLFDEDIKIKGKTATAYLKHVTAAEKSGFEESVRTDTSVEQAGYPDFKIQPEGDRSEYLVVTYIEPYTEQNRVAHGFDAYSEESRREAAKKARDTGMPASTPLLQIVRGDSPQGFIIFLPIFDNTAPQNTVEERRAAFSGMVSVIFEINSFMQEIVDSLVLSPNIDVEIFDGEPRAENLVYDTDFTFDNDQSVEYQEVSTPFVDRTWTIRVSEKPGFFQGGFTRWAPLAVMAGGLLLSFFIALEVQNLSRNRRKAEQVASSKIKELATSEQNFEEMLEAMPDPVAIIAKNGMILRVNRATEEAAGYSRQELVGKFFPRTGILTPTSLPIVLKNFATILRGKQHPPYEAVFKHKDGSHITFELNARPLFSDGKVQAVQVVFRDVTKRSQLQKTLESQRTELERINKFMVGRELKMSEMKREVEELRKKVGEE